MIALAALVPSTNTSSSLSSCFTSFFPFSILAPDTQNNPHQSHSRHHSRWQYLSVTELKLDGYDTNVFELSNNHIGMNAVNMLGKKQITKGVYINVLSYLMFLKRKMTGDIKARGCDGSRPQREYISKEESSSPTVST